MERTAEQKDRDAREGLSPGQVFGRRMREVRRRRGWSQQALADRLEELGHPINRATLAKIERGAEGDANSEFATRAKLVPLEHVLAISFALGVSPLHMIVPFDPSTRLQVVAKRQSVDPYLARDWLRGEATLLDEDVAFFQSEVPRDDVERAYEAARRVTLDESQMAVIERLLDERLARAGITARGM